MDIDVGGNMETDYNLSHSGNSQMGGMDAEWRLPKIDDAGTSSQEKSIVERFIAVLDQLDTRVEKIRKEALNLQEKRDYLLMSIDLIKNNELLASLDEYEREEVTCYLQRINSRLGTVDLNVKTVRDPAQEESLHQINILIDSLITNNDPVMARQRCQTFLNACYSSDASMTQLTNNVDKKFENALLGCALDDQKNIKRRLMALMNYLNKQTVSA